jgi:hypothetical protein
MRRQIVANDSPIFHHKSHSFELGDVHNWAPCNGYEISKPSRSPSRQCGPCQPSFSVEGTTTYYVYATT